MKKLLLVGTLMCALSNAAHAQSDEVKTLIQQEETLNTINVPSNSTILPERMFIDDPKDDYNYPELYIDYPDTSIINGINISIYNHKLELGMMLNHYQEHPPFISAQANDFTIQLSLIKGSDVYHSKITEEATRAFIENFTSAKQIDFMVNNQKISASLEGLSNLFNNFLKLVEEKQISLPPPFKTYESNLLNDQAIKHLSKPTQTKISNTSLQNALIALSKIDCQKAAESLINIVSSCYKNMNNTNDSIDTCVAEDNFASVWLYFSKHSLNQKQLSTNSNFFSEEQRFIRNEQYMDSRFDDSEKNTNYFMPFHTFDFMKYLNQKCRPI